MVSDVLSLIGQKLEPSQLELRIPAEPSMDPLHLLMLISQRLSQYESLCYKAITRCRAKRAKLVQLTQESMMNTRPIITGSVEFGYGKASLTEEEQEKHRVLVEEASKLPGLIYTTDPHSTSRFFVNTSAVLEHTQ